MYVAFDSLTLYVCCTTLLLFKNIFSIREGDKSCLTLTKPTRTEQTIGSHHGPANDIVILLLAMGDTREMATQWETRMVGAQSQWAMPAAVKWTAWKRLDHNVWRYCYLLKEPY